MGKLRLAWTDLDLALAEPKDVAPGNRATTSHRRTRCNPLNPGRLAPRCKLARPQRHPPPNRVSNYKYRDRSDCVPRLCANPGRTARRHGAQPTNNTSHTFVSILGWGPAGAQAQPSGAFSSCAHSGGHAINSRLQMHRQSRTRMRSLFAAAMARWLSLRWSFLD